MSRIDGAPSPAVSVAEVVLSAEDGSTGASINTTGVRVVNGRLTHVRLTHADTGEVVAGTVSDDGARWSPDERLERGTKYLITATARDAEGRTATENAAFTTVSSANSFVGTYQPDDGTTVGVGMPVSFTFDKPIDDRRAVESAITVSSTSGQRVVGHWFGPQRLDFRPEEYWESGAEVTVRIDLDGVEGADGVHGVQRKTVEFTVGRSQVSTVDVATQTMTVVRDGAPFESIPISSGGPGTPTYNGRMVISQKFVETRMDGSTVGFDYDIPDAPHAMRLTRSGTFLHGNYWYDGANPPFGVAGTSHGCVGLRDVRGGGADTPGKWFFDHSLVGDVVIVENSPDATVEPDNGLNGWNMPWSQWVAGSSL
ncbi:Ig-like domain-containing protein [Streptomyces sp. ZYX-F-203]